MISYRYTTEAATAVALSISHHESEHRTKFLIFYSCCIRVIISPVFGRTYDHPALMMMMTMTMTMTMDDDGATEVQTNFVASQYFATVMIFDKYDQLNNNNNDDNDNNNNSNNSSLLLYCT